MTVDPPEGEPSGGHLRPTSGGVLVGWAIVGLVGGWLLHGYAERYMAAAPVVTWAQPLALLLVAAILGTTAWLTYRSIHVHHQRPEAHRMVNRLVLARACALVGALMAGGYAGYALSWLGVQGDLASQRAWRSAAAAAAGVAIAITAVLLERACRVGSDGDDT
ncbi:putative membrane protein [Nocardioides ginsengisegetis]|uniref:Putative membrane protein n=1 Tax=Nocardioides ginsengisegetis TaxID=661491 RepID=A0A7W3J2Q4_9ACTN|nr:putative membrane protein [Nocardioides ginsengisegetis]